jgi:hypothetical protein
MSTLQEGNRVISVKYLCHKATRTPNVIQQPAWLTQLSYQVDTQLYPDLCKARHCFIILKLRSFQFNALSCGNKRPNLPYEKAVRDIFGGIQYTSDVTGNSVTLLVKFSLLNIDVFLTTHSYFTSIYPESSANKSRSYLHIIVCCCGLEFQFLSVPTQSRLHSRSTRSHSTFPTDHRLWDTSFPQAASL